MVNLTWLAHTSELAERVKNERSHGRSQKFSGGVRRRHFAYYFQVADVTMPMDAHKTLYCSTPQRKCPMKARAPFASVLNFFSNGAVTNLTLRCRLLYVIRYRFCWIGTYSHNWVWNGPELLMNTFGVLSLVCAGWTDLTSEIFCPNCFLHFAYQKCFFFS